MLNKNTYDLLFEYCILKQIQIAELNNIQRETIINTLGFLLFKLNRELRLLACNLGFHKWEISYYTPDDFKGYYSNLVWHSCSRCKYCQKLQGYK